MRFFDCAAAFVAVVCSCATNSDPKVPKKGDIDALQGTWILIAKEENGKVARFDQTGKDKKTAIYLTFKGDTCLNQVGDEPKETREAIVSIDQDKTPCWIDFTLKDGENKGKVIRRVYQLKDDTFKECYIQDSEKRPTEFGSGNGQVVLTWARVKK
jgi:uncharacterized protein (TIGR03067 family)